MLIEKFLEYLTLEKKYAQHTITAYRADITSFQQFCIEEFQTSDISKVNYVEIRNWITSLITKDISNRSVNRKITSLKSFFRYLVQIEHLDKSPLDKHKALKTSKKVQIPFSVDEVRTVLDSLETDSENIFKSKRDRLIIELLYTTGIRRTELVNIKLKDVDLANLKLKVIGKRNKERIIPLLLTIEKSFKAYLNQRKLLENSNNTDFLFLTERGVKIYEMLVYRVVNSYFSYASTKLKKSPHMLRHSFATHLLGNGADLNAIKELLGHASLASTQIYTHQSIVKLKEMHKNAHPRNNR
ncbi:tyrosine-type recombinase/integrase [Aquimarina sp. ERC-38]|uniref:tyrosine-type recombinase/integrase n=1 Tax=Aquimarina sp. ERC-38 TaxID=2949996 RepID=UPI00224861F8|nr:tyrosine-type recombinase/integrase [Aquimarina sp. ERC-38]UZO79395.1 tyrosine-type recombinase/integrase [Aquimarina sp. ERC-38]